MNLPTQIKQLTLLCAITCLGACEQKPTSTSSETESEKDSLGAISQPLVTELYTADPSAHVFEGKIYIYPSHDIEAGIPANDQGDHFGMVDYRVFSMEGIGSNVTDHGVALHIDSVPWAGRQMWAPDAGYKNGTYYFYFPAKDKDDVFRIGVATSTRPEGPFEPGETPIEGSYSIDPTVFTDEDGSSYMYFGGIWGGQLQRWESGGYVPYDSFPAGSEPAIKPRVAKMSNDMLGFAEKVRQVDLLGESGQPLLASDNKRRFFEAAWIHKYNGKYYFSYSTGDTHFICYATGDSPYGPFTYQGIILEPVIGWTSHHSIVEVGGKWYLFYHDSVLSGGQTHLRNIKVTELTHQADGSIATIEPYVK